MVAIDASHLFKPSTTKIGFRQGTFLRAFMYDFIQLFAPHLTKELVDACIQQSDRDVAEKLFNGIELPLY